MTQSAAPQDQKQGRCEMLGATPTVDDMCGQPAVYRYPALGGGYMRLCEPHAHRHIRYCERWSGTAWEGARDGE